jgi:ATP-binding cassette, subfamily B, multidrug efflux pump
MKHLFHLNKYFWKYRGRLFMGFFFILLTNIFNVYAPVVVGEGVDFLAQSLSAQEQLKAGAEVIAVPTPTSLQWLGLEGISDEVIRLTSANLATRVTTIALLLALAYIVFYALKGVFLFYQRQTIIVMSRHIEYDAKNEIYDHYQRLDPAFYKRHRTGDLMNRISEDVNRVRMYLGPAVMYTINLVVLVVMCVAVMWKIDPELTLYTLAPLPFMMLAIFYVSNIINRRTEQVQRQQSHLSTMVQETMSGVRLVKSFHRENYFAATFTTESDRYKGLQLQLVKADALFMPVIVMLVGMSTLLTIFIGANKVMEGSITYGVIVQFVFYVNQLTWPFASVGWVSSLVQKAEASQERINDFLRTAPDITDDGTVDEIRHGKITFRNVTFTYPDSGITALKNVSFELQPGERLGVMGRTGSGKSTLAQLLLRMYEPTEGEILIDDLPLNHYRLSALREAIGYVPQEVFLFSDTLYNNIAFGTTREPHLASDEVMRCCRLAAIHDTIVQFPQGYETMLGERGINLSGGQKQRLSIARALIKKPTMLVLDDCLSAVDTETEEHILQGLSQEMKGKTSIVFGHRVSGMKLAQRILILEEGRSVEMGDHAALMALNGIYAATYRKQMEEGNNPAGT